MQPTKDPLAMTLMMDDVRQALALHQPSLADTLAAGSLLMESEARLRATTDVGPLAVSEGRWRASCRNTDRT